LVAYLAVRNEKMGMKDKTTGLISEQHLKQTLPFVFGCHDQTLYFANSECEVLLFQ